MNDETSECKSDVGSFLHLIIVIMGYSALKEGLRKVYFLRIELLCFDVFKQPNVDLQCSPLQKMLGCGSLLKLQHVKK